MLPVFISFQMEDESWKNILAASLSASGVGFLDYSIQEQLDSAWQEASSARIEQAMGTVVIIGARTYESRPVAWEIAESIRRDKPVIGIRTPAGSAAPVPEGLEARSVLRWDIDALTDAVVSWRGR